MHSKNLLSLQDAIVVALIHYPLRRAHFKEILKTIKDRNFYNFNPQESFPPFCEGLKLFYDELGKDDSYYFHDIGSGYIEIKDTNAYLPIILWDTLSKILAFEKAFFEPESITINVFDPEFEIKREISIRPDEVVCIISNDKEMGKDIYLISPSAKDLYVFKKYKLNSDKYNFKSLLNTIDPLNNYLVHISKSVIVNVAYFNLSKNNSLTTIETIPKGLINAELNISDGKNFIAALPTFKKLQYHYNRRIFLQNLVFPSNL